ncbi:gfo/Idh/MocA family oxidoreductase [Aeromicrobium phragmitis]|uniref:Gfo/Idh/MocA family oxidoreductase n=1 Tax=Aeromicrobium phragmitis TaxID=2478914 RepID=A0A3L8PP43_9ACTN|nr:Gfo/Idh/MocA family oxidoreductase [Aeromicrobium phragmitis]RLV56208.1 gfo/Idh/MocA family oxidoreductase [Aeromicrobium phragmitis]
MSPAPTPLGVAVVGHSFMGKAHSNAWRNVSAFYPDVPPVARRVLVGRDATRVGEAAHQLGWEGTETDWRRVLERDDVQIVDVCTPGHLHYEIALAALEAGKHVLVEKPLSNSTSEAERLVEAAASARGRGVQSMVGFNYRRVPALALARSLVAEGRIGQLREIRAAYLQDWLADDQAPMTWRLRREQAGSGVLGDLGSHVVDLLRFLTADDISWVEGHLATFVPTRPGADGPEQVTVDDAAWALLGLNGGAVASVEVSRMAFGRKNGLRLELYGSRGSLTFDLERLNELWVDTGDGGTRVLVTEPHHPYLEAWWPPGHILGWDHTFTTQAAEFLHAIGTGTAPAPSFEDGLAVQRVLDAVERTASDRRATIPAS